MKKVFGIFKRKKSQSTVISSSSPGNDASHADHSLRDSHSACSFHYGTDDDSAYALARLTLEDEDVMLAAVQDFPPSDKTNRTGTNSDNTGNNPTSTRSNTKNITDTDDTDRTKDVANNADTDTASHTPAAALPTTEREEEEEPTQEKPRDSYASTIGDCYPLCHSEDDPSFFVNTSGDFQQNHALATQERALALPERVHSLEEVNTNNNNNNNVVNIASVSGREQFTNAVHQPTLTQTHHTTDTADSQLLSRPLRCPRSHSTEDEKETDVSSISFTPRQSNSNDTPRPRDDVQRGLFPVQPPQVSQHTNIAQITDTHALEHRYSPHGEIQSHPMPFQTPHNALPSAHTENRPSSQHYTAAAMEEPIPYRMNGNQSQLGARLPSFRSANDPSVMWNGMSLPNNQSMYSASPPLSQFPSNMSVYDSPQVSFPPQWSTASLFSAPSQTDALSQAFLQQVQFLTAQGYSPQDAYTIAYNQHAAAVHNAQSQIIHPMAQFPPGLPYPLQSQYPLSLPFPQPPHQHQHAQSDPDLEFAITLSLREEDERRQRLSEEERNRRESVERANEEALRLALQQSFEELERDKHRREVLAREAEFLERSEAEALEAARIMSLRENFLTTRTAQRVNSSANSLHHQQHILENVSVMSATHPSQYYEYAESPQGSVTVKTLVHRHPAVIAPAESSSMDEVEVFENPMRSPAASMGSAHGSSSFAAQIDAPHYARTQPSVHGSSHFPTYAPSQPTEYRAKENLEGSGLRRHYIKHSPRNASQTAPFPPVHRVHSNEHANMSYSSYPLVDPLADSADSGLLAVRRAYTMHSPTYPAENMSFYSQSSEALGNY